ncbi:MAG: ABC transporter substrate-binding protein [Clostridia bacterium]|nr:ABC transporter substrate-binding protein [Clostridia bacterium]
MKKVLAMVLALCLMLAVGSAFAEDTITLKIAHIGPLTGPAALYGVATSRGCQIAIDEINAAGGKYKIELIDQDDQHNPEISKNAYQEAKKQGAQMIVGTTTSDPCIAVGEDAYADRMFMLTPSASSVKVTAGKDNVYQMCFTDPAQGVTAANYIADNSLGSKIAIITNVSDPYSTGIRDAFLDTAEERGLEIVSETEFNEGDADFTVQVNDAKNAGADLVFLPIYYGPASMIIQTSKNIGFEPRFFGVDGMDGILAIPEFDVSLAEGVMLLCPFAASSPDELTQKFVKAYEAKFNDTPIQFAADSYDCVYALVAAAEKAGITSDMSAKDCCEKLIAAMQELEYTGLTGTSTWDASGAVTKQPKVYIIKDGAYAEP